MRTNSILQKPDDVVIDLIKRSGNMDIRVAEPAQYELAKALEMPLRQGVLVGDVVRSLYEAMVVQPGASVEFPLDLLAPGDEGNFVAFTNPGNGRIPERQVEGDYVMVPTYSIAGAIDWLLKFAREGRFDVVGRAMQVLEAQFVKKINDDGWHTMITAAADRNLMVFDANANAGQFTKRLISLMKVVVRRNAGGNTASIKRGKLTDMFVSLEAEEDIRNWGLDQIDEFTRREYFLVSEDGSINEIFGVKLHELFEFGQNQEYQLFFTNSLGGTLPTSIGNPSHNAVEMVIGLDMMNRDSFLMPIKEEISIFPDPQLHRQQRQGYYGWGEFGFAVLDSRRVVMGAF
jgi:hypothetical protein